MKVLLSTTLILTEGTFQVDHVTKEQAEQWLKANVVVNYCGHQTTKLLGITPSTTREQCDWYTQALCLKSKERLEFGRDYSVEEIEEIGVEFTLITLL